MQWLVTSALVVLVQVGPAPARVPIHQDVSGERIQQPAALDEPRPDGWARTGPREAFAMYALALDKEVKRGGATSLRIRSTELQSNFGTVLMQRFAAEDYRGTRVQLAGYARADGLTSWAGLWLRIDGPENQQHDNMSDRPIRGTIDWQRFTLVLDVPVSATVIYIGALMNGRGTLWLDEFELTVVDRTVPVTGTSSASRYTTPVPDGLPRGPRNLRFEPGRFPR